MIPPSDNHPLSDDDLNERAEQTMLDALMANQVAVGDMTDRRLFRYMVIRHWISPVAPHVILPAGLILMSECTRPYPSDEREIA